MKIMIIGSMCFSKEMLAMKGVLEGLGYAALVPCDTDLHVSDPLLRDDFERDKTHVLENDIIRKCLDSVAEADAVLMLNLEQKGIQGYIGVSALMEIGLAYYLRKKIFVLNPVAQSERYANDMDVMGAVTINGDLSKIS